jgi:putative ABC transport system permease protein
VTFGGLAIGIPAALLLTRVLSSQLFSVTPADPLTFVVVTVALGVVSLVAAYLPARSAAEADPAAALRRE